MLGAYALDTLEPDEHQDVERHLRVCAACRAEVAEHQEVAGLLTPGWEKPPALLWDRIATSLRAVTPLLEEDAPRRGTRPRAAPPSGRPGGWARNLWGARRQGRRPPS